MNIDHNKPTVCFKKCTSSKTKKDLNSDSCSMNCYNVTPSQLKTFEKTPVQNLLPKSTFDRYGPYKCDTICILLYPKGINRSNTDMSNFCKKYCYN